MATGLPLETGKDVTEREFHVYRMQVRAARSGDQGYLPVGGGEAAQEFSAIHHSGRLGQEYVLDAYLQVEAGRQNFLRFNQATHRAEFISGLLDAARTG